MQCECIFTSLRAILGHETRNTASQMKRNNATASDLQRDRVISRHLWLVYEHEPELNIIHALANGTSDMRIARLSSWEVRH